MFQFFSLVKEKGKNYIEKEGGGEEPGDRSCGRRRGESSVLYLLSGRECCCFINKTKRLQKKKPKFKPNRRLRLAEKTEKLKWVMKNCKECECRTTKES